MTTNATVFRKRPIAAAVSSALAVPAGLAAVPVFADQSATEEIIVTATRRAEGIQDIPINIAAVSAQEIEEQGITDLAEVAAWVPGLHIVDQGSRAADRIVVRGLNADPIGSSEALDNEGGGIVATYVGEIPLYIDLKLNDMERVEVLLGPQGTLYGAGTMGGAIRYIPTKPQFDEEMAASIRGDFFTYSEADDPGYDLGITFNHAFSDSFAIRGSVDYLDDPGFIDYNYLVREIGVSNADPDFTDPADVAANLRRAEDANTEEVISGRVAARWAPSDLVDATLTYYFQYAEAGARTITHQLSPNTPAGPYESAMRVLEPNDRDNDLIALEVISDLGFAELTAAVGISSYEEEGQRDQTDLLIGLEYSYEAFPSFTAFTLEEVEEDRTNIEVRLVSQNDSPFSWIGGFFWNEFETDGSSKEFTPGYDQFAVDNFGGVGLRPDSLEYFAVSRTDLTEMALFGEVSWQINERWDITVGGRWYDYELETEDAVDLPLLNTVFFGDAPDAITLDFEDGGQEDDGFLFKFNTSYDINDDVMAYFTLSEGYRIGNSNGVAPCPDPLPANQIICALPNEFQYFPDETTNYEVGIRSQFMGGKVTLNGTLYFIEWDAPQIESATENGLSTITVNGESAESQGYEVSLAWLISDNWTVRASYAFNEAELSDDAPRLVPFITPPGFQSTIDYEDGRSGDRLPGSPEEQFSLFVNYNQPLSNGLVLDANYSLAAISDVITRTGRRGGGDTLGGYSVHNLSLALSSDKWTATLYADNLTDKYALTGIRGTSTRAQTVSDINGDPVNARTYFANVLTPRQIGLRFTYDL